MAPYTPADGFCGVYTILVSAVWEFFLSRHLDRFWDWVFGLFSRAPPPTQPPPSTSAAPTQPAPSSSSAAPGPDWEGRVRLLEARLEQTSAQLTEAKATITAWERQDEVAESRAGDLGVVSEQDLGLDLGLDLRFFSYTLSSPTPSFLVPPCTPAGLGGLGETSECSPATNHGPARGIPGCHGGLA